MCTPTNFFNETINDDLSNIGLRADTLENLSGEHAAMLLGQIQGGALNGNKIVKAFALGILDIFKSCYPELEDGFRSVN